MQSSFAGRALLVAVGVLLGIGTLYGYQHASLLTEERCHEEYSLLNPFRRCSPENIIQKKEYETFRDEIDTWIKLQQQGGVAEHVSIYFRDLENGPWFGIQEDILFSPMSLLKVPIMMATFKLAEEKPNLLKEEIAYEGNFENLQNVQTAVGPLEPGKYYSMHELLRRMVAYSDNVAAQLVKARLMAEKTDTGHPLGDTFYELGIIDSARSVEDSMSIKSYASIFRILYNASYLSRDYSNEALDMLSQSTFDSGLVAGVPKGTRVAHKFGVRDENDTIKQLHDCGIVYHPETPYLLCIMTRGKDLVREAAVIQELSRLVYEEVDARAKVE